MSDPTKLAPGEEWDATQGALAQAEATGVDIATVQGTGKGGTVTKADVTAVSPTSATVSASAVKTPSVAKIEADAKQRATDKAVADAQVAEDSKALQTARSDAKTAAAVQVVAEANALKAIDAAAKKPADEELSNAGIKAHLTAVDAAAASEAAVAKVVELEAKLAISIAKADLLKPLAADSPWWYCLETGHAPNVIHDDRFFQSDEDGCPTCPVCKRQVSAVPAANFGVYPSGILAVAARLT
jgi:pyruvate/2-oxoglutarate dehydrogenase complex dihydrolipoamide acyltransferase (E2) component